MNGIVSFVGKWMKLDIIMLRKITQIQTEIMGFFFVFVYKTYILYSCIYNMYLEGNCWGGEGDKRKACTGEGGRVSGWTRFIQTLTQRSP